MDQSLRELAPIHVRYAPVDARVAEILGNVRRMCETLPSERRNQGNERQVEEFIASLKERFDRLLKWGSRVRLFGPSVTP